MNLAWVQAQTVLEFPVVVLDPPADLRQADQFGDRGNLGQVGQPEPGRFLLAVGPFGQQPHLGQDAVPPAVLGHRGGLGQPA
ncbi:hypothetical protein M271_12045 [Streptomyces rapamycinicus NRRL 5491]|nr:hypothetical protein M271_12045 [Streptomyces rapamycinicus NRRL 5491]